MGRPTYTRVAIRLKFTPRMVSKDHVVVTPASEFVKDLTVALAAAPVSSSVSVTSLVVNRPWVLQLSEPTADLLLGLEKWAAREITCISGDSVAHRTLVECLSCTRCLALHWGWRGMKCTPALLRTECSGPTRRLLPLLTPLPSPPKLEPHRPPLGYANSFHALAPSHVL